MSCINVTNVSVRNNPAPVLADLEFEISFECLQDLQEDVEWKVIYVGCPNSKELDQELDAIDLGPITVGAMKFVFQAPHPKFEKIPNDDIVGVAAVMLSASYRSREFIRIGYYVNNYYEDQELIDNPPDVPDFSKLKRLIIQENPRVTRFNIEWDSASASADAPAAPAGQQDEEMELEPGNGNFGTSTTATSTSNSPPALNVGGKMDPNAAVPASSVTAQ